MKILQVTNRFYPSLGGVETHVLEVSKRLVGLGHEVTVLSSDFSELRTNIKYIKEKKKGTIFGITYKKFWSFRVFGVDATTFPVFMPLWLFLNIRKYDVIHTHTYGYIVGWLPILIAKILRVKNVFTPHYSDKSGISPGIKRVYNFFFGNWQFKISDVVIALTETEKKEIEQKYSQRENVFVIPNGITKIESKTEYFTKEELFTNFNIDSKFLGSRLLFSIGRLDKRKGFIYLLQAVKLLGEQNIICVIYGSDWGEYKNLYDFVKENKLSNVYIITEMSQMEKNSFLEISDLFVLPSLQEAFGIVYLEAMQHGVPCIGTDVGAIKDVVLPDYGSLAKNSNAEDLAEKIVFELAKKRNKQSLITHANKYDWDHITEQIIKQIYEKNT